MGLKGALSRTVQLFYEGVAAEECWMDESYFQGNLKMREKKRERDEGVGERRWGYGRKGE